MKAMIFAAGLGTRLKPITDDRPKALAEIHGTPLLEIVIRRLINFGFNEIIVNVHHFADRVLDFLDSKNNFGIDLHISDERDELLDTGGGLKKASWFFDDNKPFLVHNVDTLTDIDLVDYYDFHTRSKALATLLVRHRSGSRFFLFDAAKRLCGWENIVAQEKILATKNENNLERIAFSCLHIIHPGIFDLMDETGRFSIIDVYLRLADSQPIYGYVDDRSYWLDVGTPEKLARGEKEIEVEKLIGRSRRSK
ncbi:MAG: nucleotidyltransferase family protein [Cytophagales bacterium]|nr:nucleotidyltransferase family protein [Cytophagales bacterium]